VQSKIDQKLEVKHVTVSKLSVKKSSKRVRERPTRKVKVNALFSAPKRHVRYRDRKVRVDCSGGWTMHDARGGVVVMSSLLMVGVMSSNSRKY
jgi:hypothetical protein